MKPFVWKEGMSPEEAKDGAYWERNMLALLMANMQNAIAEEHHHDSNGNFYPRSGWYYDTDNNWDGWKRVISIAGGSITFHIPDDFDVGNLPEIEPNWDGHTTEQKWTRIMQECGCRLEDV